MGKFRPKLVQDSMSRGVDGPQRTTGLHVVSRLLSRQRRSNLIGLIRGCTITMGPIIDNVPISYRLVTLVKRGYFRLTNDKLSLAEDRHYVTAILHSVKCVELGQSHTKDTIVIIRRNTSFDQVTRS